MEWTLTPTDRGVGFTCPREECDGKLVLNLDLVKATRKQLSTKALLCPYCECVSLLPREVLR